LRVPNEQDSEGYRTIICDGKSTKVQKNLYEALLNLRSARPGYCWIDSICINQKDEAEKTVQVQMMGHIYHEANRVVVWLGSLPMLLEHGLDWFINAEMKVAPEKDGKTVDDVTSREFWTTFGNSIKGGLQSGPTESACDKFSNSMTKCTTVLLFLTRRWW
jgi:hypothetical protein